MQPVIFDSSALIQLYKAEAIHCLPKLFDTIYIPEAVKNECKDNALVEALAKPPFEIKKVANLLPIGLGAGEREAISLAKELSISSIFINDKKGINKARSLNLSPLRGYRILILAKEKGLISSVKEAMNKIIKAGDRIEDEHYVTILKQAGEAE